ncbi:MAG: Glycogen biosynthesis protein GlgD [Firmicutes bacterium ADurb.Bin182]|nr:MAG: Glycogen biosynthesis protein GlgD [Firmicutes bacterium ADurb.Bin182]
MIGDTFGLIYTGESNMELRDLTHSRSVAAVPFGGRYRCIDFLLSCMVNSGIINVGVIAQKNYHSLMDHLGSGKEWDLNRKRDGLFILPPFMTRENTGIYKGTVDALRSCMGYIRRSPQRYILLTGSHVIYNTTYNKMAEQHITTGADITIMYSRNSAAEPDGQYDDLRLTLDETGRVTDLALNPYRPKSDAQSCDAFLMEKTLLEYLLEESVSHANYDFTRDILLKKTETLRMFGWEYKGYVARINSLESYFKHNMALLNRSVSEDLFNPEHPIYTKVKDEVPAYYAKGAAVSNSFVADGCIIEGEVENSVLFRGVRVAKGASVKNSILMQAAEVQEQCALDHVVLDKSVIIKRGRSLKGYDNFPIILRKGTVL